ncbi:hypothetical protein ACQEU3_44235 [Spirillospora sp. CA-253888]
MSLSDATIDPEQLTGAWILHRVLLGHGGRVRPMPGCTWNGLLLYTADRHFSATLSVSVGPLRKAIAYAGTFEIDDVPSDTGAARVLHDAAVATLPLRPGRTQRRIARLRHDPTVLTLTAAWRGWAMDLAWTRPDSGARHRGDAS